VTPTSATLKRFARSTRSRSSEPDGGACRATR
jgi:hypothetical protein